MKIHHWIDKYNYKVSFKIIKKYHSKIAEGGSPLYSVHPTFWGDYLLRILLVVFSIITLKKSAYNSFYNIISSNLSAFFSGDRYPKVYIRLRDLISTLLGYRYFVEQETLPLLDRNSIFKEHINIKISTHPFVSIVIKEVTRLDFLYNCLKSLEKNLSDQYAFEIKVVTRDKDLKSFLNRNVKGVIIEDEIQSAAITEANFIYLISGDTQVKKNTIEFLIKTLEKKSIPYVVSKVLSKNGLLLQTGTEGNFDNPNHPDFNYQKDIPPGSFKSLLIRKESFSSFHSEKNIAGLYQPLSSVICFNDQIGPGISTAAFTPVKTNQKTILFIDDVIPMPDQDSGSNRIFKIMQLTQSLGFHVMFLPANGEKKPKYFEQMVLEGFEVIYRFPNRQGMIKILMERLHRIDMVWICKPHNNEAFQFLFERKKDLRWIYDTIDLHFLRLQREGELSKDENIIQSANAVKQVEIEIAKHADVTIAITSDEQTILQNEQIKNVVIIPNIHEIKIVSEEAGSFEQRKGLLFIGGYLHKPNVDAVEWLVRDIMPLIWQKEPSITLTLLGSSPTKEVLALQSEQVIIPGYIHDVSPYFNNNKIFVAPLRFGAGMKGKIGQSLEFGLPIVSTDIGVEGIGLTDSYDVMVANETRTFAEKTIELYNSPELWNKIRTNSINALKAYTPEVVQQQLKELLKSLQQKKD